MDDKDKKLKELNILLAELLGNKKMTYTRKILKIKRFINKQEEKNKNMDDHGDVNEY